MSAEPGPFAVGDVVYVDDGVAYGIVEQDLGDLVVVWGQSYQRSRVHFLAHWASGEPQ